MGLTTVQRYCAACDFIFCENATNLIIIMIVIRGDAMGGGHSGAVLSPLLEPGAPSQMKGNCSGKIG